jgi:hypothetical protein
MVIILIQKKKKAVVFYLLGANGVDLDVKPCQCMIGASQLTAFVIMEKLFRFYGKWFCRAINRQVWMEVKWEGCVV